MKSYPYLDTRKKPYTHKFIGFRVINPGDVDWYARLSHVQVLDIRSPEEYNRLHIPSAINFPFDDISHFIPEPRKEYLICCRSGKKSEFSYFMIKEKYPRAKLAVIRFGFQGWQLETEDERTKTRMRTRPRESVVLMTPSANQDKLWGKFTSMNGFYMPIQIMTIADVLDANGYEAHLLDASCFDFPSHVVEEYIRRVRPAVVGLTTYTATAYDVFRTVRLIKKIAPEIKIIAGGIHCSIFPEKTVEECREIDAVCFGEGEKTMLEFCNTVIRDRSEDYGKIDGLCTMTNGKVVKNAPRKQIPVNELGEYLNPSYHLVPMERYVPPAANYYELPTYSTFVNRGCPFKCNFCNAGDVFGTLGRYRPLATVINELKYLKKHYNMKGMYFMDGTFATNQRWVDQFCDTLIKEEFGITWFTWTRVDLITQDLANKMKKSGCWKVGVGVESGNQQSLDLLRKGLSLEQIKQGVRRFQKARIQVNGSYILGIPGETVGHVENTLRFAKELKTESAIFFLPVPMPGGGFFELARKYGGLRTTDIENWNDYTTFNFKNPLYINPLIGKEKSLEYYNTSFSRFFINPGVIWRNLRHVKNLRDLMRLFAGFHSIIYFFKPSILARSLTQRLIAYQGADRMEDSNLLEKIKEAPELNEKKATKAYAVDNVLRDAGVTDEATI